MQRLSRIFAILILAFLPAHPAPAKVVYVAQDATGDGSGSSWENACTTIAAGLAASASGDQIWVKSATYPEAIEMKEGVVLYGGFPVAGSPSFEQRDWRANKTIIDATGLNTHVVVGADFAIMDGFTLTGGRAGQGGGVYCYRTSPTLSHCTIAGNKAAGGRPDGVGGGVYCYASSPIFIGCTISDNLADYIGAGFACGENSSPMLRSCLITRNSSALTCDMGSNPTLINCSVAGNLAGVGVWARGTAVLTTNRSIK